MPQTVASIYLKKVIQFKRLSPYHKSYSFNTICSI